MVLIKLLRVPQWVKNFFVFLPIFFNKQILDVECLILVVLTFFAFCLASSGIYCLNDIIDVEEDRQHPKKCKRPIASGQVTVPAALGIMVALFAAAIAISYFTPADNNRIVMGIITLYIVLNIAYCLKLKNYAIIDTMIIAVGFVLRLIAGGIVIEAPLSPWIVMMTFLLALFLAFAKRHDDVLAYQERGVKQRKNIQGYNIIFINTVMAILSAVILVCYIMYTVSPEVTQRLNSQYVYATTIFVVAALIKYNQLTLVVKNTGSPTKVLLKSTMIQLCVVGWLMSFFVILYL